MRGSPRFNVSEKQGAYQSQFFINHEHIGGVSVGNRLEDEERREGERKWQVIEIHDLEGDTGEDQWRQRRHEQEGNREAEGGGESESGPLYGGVPR